MYYFGIIDCNNFYASCERIFNPSLKNRPVVVLSNNDGCVIARSNEAKLLGIKMGEPYFSAKDIILKNKVYVASTNFALYGDISRRVMQIIEEYCEESEVYSIDEAFFRIKLSSKEEVEKYSLNLIQKIKSWTGIPVSVGIGRTKTLAKLAVEFAKKKPNFLHVLYTEDNELYALKNTAIGDVWGIGRQYKLKLRSEGVFTPYDFTQKPDAWVRKIMKVIGQKVLYELRGVSCLEIEEFTSERKSIVCSRSFSHEIEDEEKLKEAICYFVAKAAEKLRKNNLEAKVIGVYIRSNPFKNTGNYYSNSYLYEMPFYSSNTIELFNFAKKALSYIYKGQYKYKKAGITLLSLKNKDLIEKDIFDKREDEKSSNLMSALDNINQKFGKNSVFLLGQGMDNNWFPRSNNASPCYTSKWSDILVVKA